MNEEELRTANVCCLLQACLLPTPKGTSCANYARCVNQILQGLGNLQVVYESFAFDSVKLYLR